MVEGIAFYALYKSRGLIITCKADDFCLFIGLPKNVHIFKKNAVLCLFLKNVLPSKMRVMFYSK